MITLLLMSSLAKYVFEKGFISPKYDIFKCNLAYGGRSIALKEIRKTGSSSEIGKTYLACGGPHGSNRNYSDL